MRAGPPACPSRTQSVPLFSFRHFSLWLPGHEVRFGFMPVSRPPLSRNRFSAFGQHALEYHAFLPQRLDAVLAISKLEQNLSRMLALLRAAGARSGDQIGKADRLPDHL